MSLAKCLSQNSLSSRANEVMVLGLPRCNKRNEAQNAIKSLLFPFPSQLTLSILEISPMATGAIQFARKYANHMSPCNSFLLVCFLRNANRTKIACSQRLKRIQLWRFQAYHSFLTKLGKCSSIFSLSLSLSLSLSRFELFPHFFFFLIHFCLGYLARSRKGLRGRLIMLF